MHTGINEDSAISAELRKHHAFAVAVCLLRRFAQAGEEVQNPTRGFNAEFRASCDDDERLLPSSRMGAMTYAQFMCEKLPAERLGEKVWEGRDSLSPEELLLWLGTLDGAFPQCEERPVPLNRARRRFGLDASSVRLSWKFFRCAADLVKCERYLHEDMVSTSPTERTLPMSNIDDAAVIIERDCTHMFGEMASIVNPLVECRRRDDAGRPLPDAWGQRSAVIAELEGLSRRLWKLSTSMGATKLAACLMLERDGGMEDLALLDKYAELMGISHRPCVGAQERGERDTLDPDPFEELDSLI